MDKKKDYKKVYTEIVKYYNKGSDEDIFSSRRGDDISEFLDKRQPYITDVSYFESFLELIKYNITLDKMLFILYCYKNYKMSFLELYPLIDKVNTEFLSFMLKEYDSVNCKEQFLRDLEAYLLKLNKSFTKLAMTGEFECDEKLPTVS